MLTLPTTSDPNRILTLKQAADIRGTSVDTLRRHFRHKFVQVSPRRLGMRYGDAISEQVQP